MTMRPATHHALSTALLAALLAPGPAAQDTAPRPLRVGTWNLQQLGARQPARSLADLRRIAAHIAAASIDVLAIQDVNDVPPVRTLVRFLGPQWRFCLGATGRTGKVASFVGFVWNQDRARIVQCEELLGLSRRAGDLDLFFRAPVSAVFRVPAWLGGPEPEDAAAHRQSRLDLRVLVVHLKDGNGVTNERTRRAEVLELRRYLDELAGLPHEDPDVMVLGSFQSSHEGPTRDALCAGDRFHYLLGPSPRPTSLGPAVPEDHIVVSPSLQTVVLAGSLRVWDDALQVPPGGDTTARTRRQEERRQAWRETYSDHFAVTVDLATDGDRDPDARFRQAIHRIAVDREGIADEPFELSPFKPGARVQLRLVAGYPGPALITGRLLTTPGTWVTLRIDDKVDKAIPADKILDMTRVD